MDAAIVQANAARAACQLVERIYLWFGVPVDRIPYTTGAGDAKVIGVETLRRGGKSQ